MQRLSSLEKKHLSLGQQHVSVEMSLHLGSGRNFLHLVPQRSAAGPSSMWERHGAVPVGDVTAVGKGKQSWGLGKVSPCPPAVME